MKNIKNIIIFGLFIGSCMIHGMVDYRLNEYVTRTQTAIGDQTSKNENPTPEDIVHIIEQMEKHKIIDKNSVNDIVPIAIKAAKNEKFQSNSKDGYLKGEEYLLAAQTHELLNQKRKNETSSQNNSYTNDFLKLTADNPMITGAIATSLMAATALYLYNWYYTSNTITAPDKTDENNDNQNE